MSTEKTLRQKAVEAAIEIGPYEERLKQGLDVNK